MSLAGMKLNSTLINELRMQKMDEDIQAGETGPTRQGEPQSVRKQEGLAQRRDGGKEPRGTRRGLAGGPRPPSSGRWVAGQGPRPQDSHSGVTRGHLRFRSGVRGLRRWTGDRGEGVQEEGRT